ncbi:alphaherpesvirus glycoprotein E domain protein [Ceratobasidium sp. AG-Ba]|nr:alphaherpesvirus glycoprotein E domain protein [Ceratobasidium sp. AG-Ba]QRW01484.1 alphaherpesvirus glycoprotein E domain protein [Ceratobasidium sp. AG-Ba]
MSASTLPPWDSIAFTFGTEPAVLTSVQRCSNVTVDYYGTIATNQIANPPPTAPYNIVVYAGGSQPLLIPVNNTATSGQYRWRVDLPAGQTYAVSMMDARGYSGGILAPNMRVIAGTNCNVASPLKPATLDVVVSGNSQCGQTIVSVNNGTAPYTIQIVSANNGQQKTIHFATSPFAITLDVSAGVEYFLSLSDSAGHSSVEGLYVAAASSENGCLGAAATVSSGMVSTLYPGGTSALSTATASAVPGSGPNGLASGAIIGIAVAVPLVAIVLVLLGLWFCYKRNRRQRKRNAAEKPDIDPYDPAEPDVQGGYTPVPTSYFGSGPNGGSYQDLSQRPADRHTVISEGATSSSGAGASSMGVSEKRRNLLNPDSHGLGPIASEPFSPSGAGGQASHSGMPPLPPAYSPSPGHAS